MRLMLALAALALSGCQTPCPPDDVGPTTKAYVCADGSDLTVTFTRTPDQAHILQEGYAPIDLPTGMTGAGYRYAQGGAELVGRGSEARWTRPGAAETVCRESR